MGGRPGGGGGGREGGLAGVGCGVRRLKQRLKFWLLFASGELLKYARERSGDDVGAGGCGVRRLKQQLQIWLPFCKWRTAAEGPVGRRLGWLSVPSWVKRRARAVPEVLSVGGDGFARVFTLTSADLDLTRRWSRIKSFQKIRC